MTSKLDTLTRVVKQLLHIVSQPCLLHRNDALANGAAPPTYAVRSSLPELKSAP